MDGGVAGRPLDARPVDGVSDEDLDDLDDNLQESAMVPGRGGRLGKDGKPLGMGSLSGMRAGGMGMGKASQSAPSRVDDEKTGSAAGGGFYSSIYDLIHVSMSVWVGAGLMVLGATLLLVKRCCCKGKSGGSRKYGHYRMVGIAGSAPSSDEISPYD